MPETIAWLILAAVHVMPALAAFRPAMLGTLYRLVPDNPLFLLMHHRAALFVGVFVLCVWAAIDPAPRPAAVVVVGISMVSFLALYWKAGSPAALRKIAMVDFIGLPALGFAGWAAFAG